MKRRTCGEDWMGGVHFSPCLRSVAWMVGLEGSSFVEHLNLSLVPGGRGYMAGMDWMDGATFLPFSSTIAPRCRRVSLQRSLVIRRFQPRFYNTTFLHSPPPRLPDCTICSGSRARTTLAGRHTIHSHRLTQKSGNNQI